MTQVQWTLLAFKTAAISGLASVAIWVAYYSRHARWWKDPIGKSLVYNAACVAAELAIWVTVLFFHLGALDSHIAGWAYVALLGMVTPIMVTRTWVWRKIVKAGPPQPPHCDTCTCHADEPER